MYQNVDFEFEPDISIPSRLPIEFSTQAIINRPTPVALKGLKGIDQNVIDETRKNLGSGNIVSNAGSVNSNIMDGHRVQLTNRVCLWDRLLTELNEKAKYLLYNL